jgi:hypothetical protein
MERYGERQKVYDWEQAYQFSNIERGSIAKVEKHRDGEFEMMNVLTWNNLRYKGDEQVIGSEASETS